MNAATAFAREVDTLFLFLVALTGFMSLLIAGSITYFALRYHKSRKIDRTLPPTEATRMEIAWTIVPLLVFLFIFGWGAKLYLASSSPPAGALEIYGTAKQWMWKFQHAEGKREINELHVPVGRPVRVILAAEDVIHSFYVPAFRVKMDVVPGRYTSLWFEPAEAGQFHLFCAEYCGTGHSRMIGKVIALPEHEYQAWLAAGGTGSETLVETGAALFERFGCKTCHLPDAGPGPMGLVRGPPLLGLFGKKVALEGGGEAVADEDYLRESILRPAAKVVAGYRPVMPTYETQLDEDALAALVAYLKEGAGEVKP
jgi:cytochrome c oxidase subunit 2